ncbi:unnamed protein product [Arabidopsis halleri]
MIDSELKRWVMEVDFQSLAREIYLQISFDIMTTRTRLRDRAMHQQLKKDLVEHIWTKYFRNQV